MFNTIFTVTKRIGSDLGTIEYQAYFEDFEDAEKFVANEVRKIGENYTYCERSHFDGSFIHSWMFDYILFELNDFAWVTDFRVNGIGFYHSGGLLTEFENYDLLKKYIKHSQEMALK